MEFQDSIQVETSMGLRQFFALKTYVLAVILTIATFGFGVSANSLPGWVIVRQPHALTAPYGTVFPCGGLTTTFSAPTHTMSGQICQTMQLICNRSTRPAQMRLAVAAAGIQLSICSGY